MPAPYRHFSIYPAFCHRVLPPNSSASSCSLNILGMSCLYPPLSWPFHWADWFCPVVMRMSWWAVYTGTWAVCRSLPCMEWFLQRLLVLPLRTHCTTRTSWVHQRSLHSCSNRVRVKYFWLYTSLSNPSHATSSFRNYVSPLSWQSSSRFCKSQDRVGQRGVFRCLSFGFWCLLASSQVC